MYPPQMPPWAILFAGPDGNLWFTEIEGNKIGKISPVTGVITEYSVSTELVGPVGITAGPDGNIWFTEQECGQNRQKFLRQPVALPNTSYL